MTELPGALRPLLVPALLVPAALVAALLVPAGLVPALLVAAGLVVLAARVLPGVLAAAVGIHRFSSIALMQRLSAHRLNAGLWTAWTRTDRRGPRCDRYDGPPGHGPRAGPRAGTGVGAPS
ncbi:hypothetical protein MTP03_44860 [Tsukamurella sp. PLM1]|nr:hypothetical protein MTP03_44860 [Tsukamurella sp. PLM1]